MALGFTFFMTSDFQASFHKSALLFGIGKIQDKRVTHAFALIWWKPYCIHLAVVMVANQKIISWIFSAAKAKKKKTFMQEEKKLKCDLVSLPKLKDLNIFLFQKTCIDFSGENKEEMSQPSIQLISLYLE